MDMLFNVAGAAEWLKQYGLWAVIISVLLNIVISVMGIVPSLFLSGANAVVFGIIPGFFISLIGEALGAGVSFFLYRWGVTKTKVLQPDNWSWLRKINDAGRKRRMLLLLFARLMPLIPSGVITFAAAVSGMSFVDFILISFIGKAPSIALETLVGHDMLLLNGNWGRLVVSLVLLSLIYVVLKKKSK